MVLPTPAKYLEYVRSDTIYLHNSSCSHWNLRVRSRGHLKGFDWLVVYEKWGKIEKHKRIHTLRPFPSTTHQPQITAQQNTELQIPPRNHQNSTERGGKNKTNSKYFDKPRWRPQCTAQASIEKPVPTFPIRENYWTILTIK